MKPIAITVFFLVSLTVVKAATYTSVGNGAWTTPSVWSPSGTPTFNDVVIIQTAVTLAAGSYNGSGSVTIQNGGTLTVSGGLTITGSGTKLIVSTNGSLQVSGALQVNNQALMTLSGGTINSGAMTVGAGTYNSTSGTATVASLTTTNSGNTNFTNGLGATFNVTGSVTSNVTFLNNGTMTISGNLTQANSGGTFTNGGQLSITGNVTANGSFQLNPGTTANSKMSIGGNMSVTGNSLTVGTNVIPGFYADLVVYQNLSFTGGSAKVDKNGRVAIFGDLNLSGGGIHFDISAGGQVYVDGDGSGNDINLTAGGNSVNNNNPNTTPPFGFYVNGTVGSPGGGSSVDADRADEVVLQNNNPSFYAWLTSQPNGPLPIVLLYFDTEVNSSGVETRWATSLETGFDHFELERAGANLQFTLIGKIDGKGGENITVSYSFIDTSPLHGKNYYRLKAVDLDGQFEYSKVVSANWTVSQGVDLYPNPTYDRHVTIDLNDKIDFPAKYELADQRGSIIQWGELSSTTEIELPENVQPGLYYMKVGSGDKPVVLKLAVH